MNPCTRSRRFALALASILLSTVIPRVVQGQVGAIVGSISVGAVIARLGDQLASLIDQARNAGNALQMEAGREVYLALQNAKNAYSESLNETFDRADKSVKSTISQLHSAADDVSRNAFGSLDQLTRRMQTTVNSLPFRQHQPQVAGVRPRFLTPTSSGTPLQVTYEGNFEFASRTGFTPALSVSGHVVPVVNNTTQELGFQIPRSLLGIPGSIAADAVHYIPVELSVPWQESKLFGIRRSRRTDTYRLLVGVLPASPGQISVTHYTTRDVVERRRFSSNEFVQCSLAECGNNDHLDVPYCVSPDAGFTIVRGTSSFDQRWNEGQNSHTFVSDDGGKACYNVSTVHKTIGASGKAIWRISFDEEKRTAVPDSTVTIVNDSQKIGLHWGDQLTFPYPAGSYLVQFTGFDGTRGAFRSADASNRLLTIADQAGNLVLVAAKPASLVWP
jgi:hypothetical protein